ncbi:hypothetical protein COGO111599_04930 [Corynebacterium gottingense]
MLGINVRDYNQTIAQDFKLDNAVTYLSIYDPPFRIATHPRTNRRVQPRAD